jgi:HEAT repeat protein/GTPase SAR1 family protein
MKKLVVLNIDNGDFDRGFSAILLLSEQGSVDSDKKITGKLPSYPQIPAVYDSWRLSFNKSLTKSRKNENKKEKPKVTEKLIPINEVREEFEELKTQLNEWLNSSGEFQVIKDELVEILKSSSEVRIQIQVDDYRLWQIPWQSWDIFQSSSNIEVALSSSRSKPIASIAPLPKNKIRVLIVVGGKKKINPEVDVKIWEDLIRDLGLSEKVELDTLIQPTRKQFYQKLWDEPDANDREYKRQGWDILFFAGHSRTNSLTYDGVLDLNENESLTIAQVNNSMRVAIALGLKLAIFNSCDGLGLGSNLTRLQVPQVIVMREEVPDPVAQTFFKNFLELFVGGASLYSAVRKARELLTSLQPKYPCAQWLPVICENPTAEPITWQKLLETAPEPTWQGCCRTMMVLSTAKRLQKNMLLEAKGMEIEDIYTSSTIALEKQFQDKAPEALSKSEKERQGRENQFPSTYTHNEFFEQVIERYRSSNHANKLALIGEAGSGKTSFLQRVGERIIDKGNSEEVAIWVSLAELKTGMSLEQYLSEEWLRDAKQLSSKFNNQSLKQLFQDKKEKKVWLLLDGADEMPVGDGNPLIALTQQISQSDWISQARIVLTCRLNTWEANKEILQSFDVYRTLEFSYGERDTETPNQVEIFVERWFGDDMTIVRQTSSREREEKKRKGQALLDSLDEKGKEKIKDLAKNPLRLWLLCLAWEQGNGSLPNTRSELYRELVNAIYEWKKERFFVTSEKWAWKQPKFKLNEDKVKELNRKLAQLAKVTLEQKISPSLKLFDGMSKLLETQSLPAKLSVAMAPNMQFLEKSRWQWFDIPHSVASSILVGDLALVLELGLLNQIGTSKNNEKEIIYAFLHPSFHEYFASEAIDAYDYKYFFEHDNLFAQHPFYGTYRALEPQWQEVVLLWFGRSAEDVPDSCKESLIKILWEFKDKCDGLDFYSHQAKFLAVAALAEFPRCNPDLVEKIVAKIGNSSLCYVNSEKDYSLPYDAVRKRAGATLLKTHKLRAKDFLEHKIINISSEWQKIMPAMLLDQIDPGNPIALNVFLDCFIHTEDVMMRYDIENWIIGSVKSKYNSHAIKTLAEWLDTERDEERSKDYATLLGAIAKGSSAKKGIDFLLDRLRMSCDQYKILYSYSKFEFIASHNPEKQEYIVKELTQIIRTLQEPDQFILFADEKIMNAAIALISIVPNNQLAVGILMDLFCNNPANSTGENIVRSFKKYGRNSQVLISALSALLDSPDIEIITDSDDGDFWRVADILGEIAFGDRIAIEALSRFLKTNEHNWRYATVAENLAKIDPGNEVAIEFLRELSTPIERQANNFWHLASQLPLSAAEKLGEVKPGDSQAITNLIKIIEECQQQFIEWIERLNINPIRASEEMYAQWHQSIDRHSRESTEYRQIDLAHNIKIELYNAVKNLGKIARNNQAAITALTYLLQAIQDEEIRLEAAKSLASIDPGNSEAIDTLLYLHHNSQSERELYSPGENVRSLAKQIPTISDPQRRNKLINAVVEVMQTHENYHQRYYTAEILGKADPGNREAIFALIELLRGDEFDRNKKIIRNLEEILPNSPWQVMREVMINNKKFLVQSYEKRSNNHDQDDDSEDHFEEWLEIFWICAENLNYLDFYLAWHNKPYTDHIKTRYIILRVIRGYAHLLARGQTYMSHPEYLLYDIVSTLFRLIKFLFLGLFYVLIILCLPLIIINMQLSKLSQRFFNYDILASIYNLIGYIIGTLLGIILVVGIMSLSIGLPLYLIYLLLAWIFRW